LTFIFGIVRNVKNNSARKKKDGKLQDLGFQVASLVDFQGVLEVSLVVLEGSPVEQEVSPVVQEVSPVEQEVSPVVLEVSPVVPEVSPVQVTMP
jgi:hypothetical protein